MATKHYDWQLGLPPPILREHSLAKHKVLERYVQRYLQVLTSTFGVSEFRLSIIDGFSGGGAYIAENTGELLPGSPLIFLNAVEAAKIEINALRTKKIDFQIDFYLCDNDRNALEFLESELTTHGYKSRIGQDIFLIEGDFTHIYKGIASKIKSKGKKVFRSMWLLDQYSYKDVPLSKLRKIFAEFPHSEILLTFGIDNLVDFISDHKSFSSALERLELNKEKQEYVIALKTSNKNWKQLAQKLLHQHLIENSGARFYTPFFITSRKSNRSYWFVHLSQHERARDEMAKLHWDEHNYFSHYGGAGLNMLGFDPRKGPDPDQQELEFGFDDDARARSKKELLIDLPKRIHGSGSSVSFAELFAQIANETPATASHVEEALVDLRDAGEIDFLSPAGKTKERARRLDKKDRLRTSFSPKLPGIGPLQRK